MNLLRKALAKVRLWMFRARRLWTDGPGYSQLLDWYLVVAGVRFEPQNGWQRFGWILYHVVGYCQLSISLVGFVSVAVTVDDPVNTIWCAIVFASELVCLADQFLLIRYGGKVEELRDFLTSSGFSSGDLEFDETTRKRFQNKSRMLIVAVGVLLVFQHILCWIPNRQQLRTFYIPPWIGAYFGKGIAIFLQVIYISIFPLFWISKLLGCSIVSTILMMGMQAEQKILVHHFEGFDDGLEDLREKYHDSANTKKQFWDRLTSLIRTSMDQQIVLLSKLKKLQSMVEIFFFYMYYPALIALGSSFFTLMAEPPSFIHFVLFVTILVVGMECYEICYLVETFKDIFKDISGHMFRLCAQLPYSEDHHRDYLEMRTTLAIIAHCSRNIVWFGCAGISDISMEVFTELCNISYSVLTFLMNTI